MLAMISGGGSAPLVSDGEHSLAMSFLLVVRMMVEKLLLYIRIPHGETEARLGKRSSTIYTSDRESRRFIFERLQEGMICW